MNVFQPYVPLVTYRAVDPKLRSIGHPRHQTTDGCYVDPEAASIGHPSHQTADCWYEAEIKPNRFLTRYGPLNQIRATAHVPLGGGVAAWPCLLQQALEPNEIELTGAVLCNNFREMSAPFVVCSPLIDTNSAANGTLTIDWVSRAADVLRSQDINDWELAASCDGTHWRIHIGLRSVAEATFLRLSESRQI